MLANIMGWFNALGVVKGDAEGLAEKLGLGEIKKISNKKETLNPGVS